MIMHVLGWLYAFCFAAALSAGITLAPLAVTWNSIWVYIAFAVCLIPGYVAAWLTLVAILGILAAIGIGALAGGTALSDKFSRNSRF